VRGRRPVWSWLKWALAAAIVAIGLYLALGVYSVLGPQMDHSTEGSVHSRPQ
jgi:hypothetical protein